MKITHCNATGAGLQSPPLATYFAPLPCSGRVVLRIARVQPPAEPCRPPRVVWPGLATDCPLALRVCSDAGPCRPKIGAGGLPRGHTLGTLQSPRQSPEQQVDVGVGVVVVEARGATCGDAARCGAALVWAGAGREVEVGVEARRAQGDSESRADSPPSREDMGVH